MELFELSAKKRRNGRRPFKVVLHEIYPNDCVSSELVGDTYNSNGICWIEEYCKTNIESIKGMSLTAEFLDCEKTQLCGHGNTGIEDGVPIFDNATIIGNFERGYIADVEVNGKQIKAMVGEGTIDQMRCNAFVKALEENLKNGSVLSGSVEISKTMENNSICYLGENSGKTGRIPTVFEYSGYALLGVQPADNSSKLLELNSKNEREENDMLEVKAQLSELLSKVDKTEEYKNELELNAQTISEQNASIDELKAALESAKNEVEEQYNKINQLYEEMNVLRQELAKAQAAKRVGELNAALSKFTDEQKKFAETEIESFNNDPMAFEVNSIVDKIHMEIGKQALEDAKAQAELNAKQNQEQVDIFSEVNSALDDKDEVSIY